MRKQIISGPIGDKDGIVSVSREEAQQIASLLEGLLSRIKFDASTPRPVAISRPTVVAEERAKTLARTIYSARRARSRFFTRGISNEPAWDMLLALYAADGGRRGYTTTEVANLSGAAATTALRWLDYLCGQGLVTREEDTLDRRITVIRLSDKARTSPDNYFAFLATEGLGE